VVINVYFAESVKMVGIGNVTTMVAMIRYLMELLQLVDVIDGGTFDNLANI